MHVGRDSSRSITFDFVMQPELMGMIDAMRAEVCAEMMKEHDKNFGSYKSCVDFMNKACQPGNDQEMDGGHKEKTSGLGYCQLFFPQELSQRAKEKEKAAAEKKAKTEAAAAAKAQAEAEAAAAAAAEALAKKKAEEEAEKEAIERKKAQQAAAKETVAKENADEKAEAEAAAAKKNAEEAAATAKASSAAAKEDEKAAAEKKAKASGEAKKKQKEEEEEGLAAMEAAKEAAQAAAEAAIAESLHRAPAPAPGPAPGAGHGPLVIYAPAPPPLDLKHLEWARFMKQDAPLPDQGFEGELINHADGDTMTADWMKERTPASQLCAICAKSPDNPWCKGKCRKRRKHPAPPEKTVVEVVRDAVASVVPGAPADPPPQPKPLIPSEPEKPDEKETKFEVPSGFPNPGDIHRSSARRVSFTCVGLVAALVLLFN